MSDDRNEGECYGPFHAGFVCRECGERYRALESEKAALEARVKELMIQGDRDRGIASQCNCSYEWDGFHSESCLMGRAERAEARAEKAEADLAALHPFIEFVQSMREAMERHHMRVPSDSMEPWIQHKGPTLRRALRGEFDEWENSLIHGGDEVKELVDTATCSFFVWRFLQRAAGRESGSLASGKQKTPGEASQDPTGTGVSAKPAARQHTTECRVIAGGYPCYCWPDGPARHPETEDGCGT